MGHITVIKLAEAVGMKPNTIHGYIERGLLEPCEGHKTRKFSSEDVQIVHLIQRLKDEPFGFSLKTMQDRIWPELSWEEVMELGDADNRTIRSKLTDIGMDD